ncbi:GatB/YqeY domain-containing protein [Pisolithus orientalis]|uniref:GatB/YqeY domain-containing protein n=1 Tax=Pisolithus orientalis TaxID=936130 RepID=UPI002224C05F|nr:GatB/YqeY domain-containing protein [Pisolithus orientalis]KAI6032796.1 GatB/YqeY domain-containing protein [Pisolithus orientalis]
MHYVFRRSMPRPGPFVSRYFHSNHVNLDIRNELNAAVKMAMKDRYLVASTTLRSVLSEVHSLDKAAGSKAPSSAVMESATEFTKRSRPDLAAKESREAEIIAALLPPLLSGSEVDHALEEAMGGCTTDDANPRKVPGHVLKAFYTKVDKSNVDSNFVKRRAEALLNANRS